MKKVFLSVICLLAFNGISNLRAEDFRFSDGVSVSTVAFSSSTVVAFIGRGIVWGIGNSTSSVLSFFDLYDSSKTIDLALGATTNPDRKLRYQNFGVSQTSIAVTSAGDTWFVKPVKFSKGCVWNFSDQTVNNARVYFTETP